MAKERKAKMAARKQRKAERLKNKRSQGKGRGGEDKGALVREFSSGKKEIWVMPGARQQESFKEEAKSHDTAAHDVGDVSGLLSGSSLSPATLASIVS